MNTVCLDGESLTIKNIVDIARSNYSVSISEDAKERVNKAQRYVQKLVDENRVVYGITTGFGKFSDVHISKDDTEALQRNLIISHACGMGDPLSIETVRAIMVMRVNALSKGNSGIRLTTMQTLVDMINKNVIPIIYEKGSLGASGDLAPLSMMVLVMIGLGEAYYNGERMNGLDAMKKAGITPIVLTSKEGLSLINGTQVMTAISALCLYDSVNVLKSADIASSLSMEALQGIIDAFDSKIHEVRGHSGQIKTALNMRKLVEGSGLITKQGELRVQDAYSLRCISQVHGASRDSIEYVYSVVEREINAATDNPLIFPDEDEVISAGNFHGQPIALVMDFLAIALSELANISERRLERLVNHQLNDLPAFLAPNGGLHSGFMIVQYAAASMVSENKVLAHPASVDSITSSANQEDHVSMGTTAARKCRWVLDNVQKVIALETFTASQAIGFRDSSKLGKCTSKVYAKIREQVNFIEEDTVMYDKMAMFDKWIKDAVFVKIVETELGESLQ